jgi:Fe-S-cluster-containing hydrogenase component 2
VNDRFQTSDPKVFAVGDTVRLGLLTEAIGAGRKAAEAIDALLKGREPSLDTLPPIPTARIKLEYYDPRVKGFGDVDDCAGECASCGSCRDCSVCVTICPQNAISRNDLGSGAYEYAVDPERCIGCGFCAGACPCGIWQLAENESLESINGMK